jgi:mRNA interferase RelE/StbE
VTTELVWTRRARQDLGRLDRQTADRAITAMTRYADTGQGDVRPLTGRPEWRLRVGDWRLLFAARLEPRALARRGYAPHGPALAPRAAAYGGALPVPMEVRRAARRRWS